MFRFTPAMHIRGRGEFKRIYDARVSVRDGCLVVYGLMNSLQHARLGLSVSRKVGNAVARNRARRRLRAAADQVLRPGPEGWDVVLVGRVATLDRPFPALVDDLRTALSRIGAAQ